MVMLQITELVELYCKMAKNRSIFIITESMGISAAKGITIQRT